MPTQWKTLAAVLTFTMTLAACDAVSGRETAGQYVDDTTITTQVVAEIVKDPSLKKMQVSVETLEREVQLSGFVDSPQNVARAGDIARRVAGVRSVRNDLVVR
jgi:osmotically-inducible protein OsmY